MKLLNPKPIKKWESIEEIQISIEDLETKLRKGLVLRKEEEFKTDYETLNYIRSLLLGHINAIGQPPILPSDGATMITAFRKRALHLVWPTDWDNFTYDELRRMDVLINFDDEGFATLALVMSDI